MHLESAMKSAAPLFDLADLAAAAAAPTPDGDALAAPWRHGDEAAFWFSRGAWAMAALVEAWRAAHGGAAPAFWLPDYFCNQSTAPVRASGGRLVFYPIGDDLEPNWPVCERMTAAGPPDIFVLVHFFGRPADGAAARRFCDRADSLLVEDGAHALGPEPDIGAVGDAVFYSLHKTLAIPDGGLLLVRQTMIASAMAAAAESLGRAAPSAAPWLTKRLVQKLLPGPMARSLIARRGAAFADDPPFAPLPTTAAPSPLACRLLARQGRALNSIALARRRNGEALARALSGETGAAPLFNDLPLAPYRLAVRADDAPALYDDWRRQGIPVETWPDLAPEVTASPAAHETALALRRTVLLLPLHAPLDLS
jgi:hypothetical protein